MLNRSEIVNFILGRYNYDTAGMLTRGSLNTYELSYHMSDFSLRYAYFTLFKILIYIAPGCFSCQSSYRSRSENVALTEQLLGIFMYSALYVTREVKVYIGRFISVEAKEGFKRYIVTVLIHYFTAHGTRFILKVKARAD